MRKRGLCCRPVSVRLSFTLVDCIQMDEDIVKLLSWPDSPIILVFDPQRRYPIQGKPLQRGRTIHGGRELGDFRLKSPFISETVRDRPMIAMER